MKPLLAQLATGISWTSDVRTNIEALLIHNGCPETAEHCMAVAALASQLAERFGADPSKAQRAGWLHDISALIPISQRLEVAQHWQLEVLPEEASAPMLLHQRLSAVIAKDLFGVKDTSILSAIACHTTLNFMANFNVTTGMTVIVNDSYTESQSFWNITSITPSGYTPHMEVK